MPTTLIVIISIVALVLVMHALFGATDEEIKAEFRETANPDCEECGGAGCTFSYVEGGDPGHWSKCEECEEWEEQQELRELSPAEKATLYNELQVVSSLKVIIPQNYKDTAVWPHLVRLQQDLAAAKKEIGR